MSRIFTLDEAQMLLPVLEALLLKARDAALAVNTLEEQMQELSQRIFLSGGMHVDVPAAARRRAEREKAMQEARSSIEEIQEIGVRVNDLGEGTLEFPALLDGRDVLLCWRIGDTRIDHWREAGDKDEVRRPIDQRFGRGERPN